MAFVLISADFEALLSSARVACFSGTLFIQIMKYFWNPEANKFFRNLAIWLLQQITVGEEFLVPDVKTAPSHATACKQMKNLKDWKWGKK